MNKHWFLWAACAVFALGTLAAERLFIQHITPKEANVLATPRPVAPPPSAPRLPDPKTDPKSVESARLEQIAQKKGMFIKGEPAPSGELPVFRFALPAGQYTLPLERLMSVAFFPPSSRIEDWTNYTEVGLTNLIHFAYPDSVYRATNKWRCMTIYHWWTWTNGCWLVRVTNATELMFAPGRTTFIGEIKAGERGGVSINDDVFNSSP